MPSKKAVEIVKMLLEKKTNLKQDLSKPENNWGSDVVRDLLKIEITSLSNEISWLQILKREIAPDCKHHKKMHDVCKGQKYCMACNIDL
jgi:hypothetical protein